MDVASGADPHLVLRVFDARGALLRTRRIPYVPVPIQPAVRDSAIGILAEQSLPRDRKPIDGADRSSVFEQIRSQLVVPAHEPPITQLIAGNDGSIWIRGAEHGAGGPIWRIFDRDGVEVGRVHAPARLRVAFADLARILGVEVDDDGVPWIVQLRLVR